MDKSDIKCYMHSDKVYVRSDGTLCHISTLAWGEIYIRECLDQIFIPKDNDFLITRFAVIKNVPSADKFIEEHKAAIKSRRNHGLL